MEAGGQLLAELPDDTDDADLRAGALPDRLPGGDGCAVLYRLYLGAALRGGVRGDHGDQSVQLDLRRVCDAPCEPACRRTDSDGPVQIRNLKRFVMDEVGHDYDPPPVPVRHGAERCSGGIGACGPDSGRKTSRRGLQGACLRDDRSARRHDDLGHPGVPAAARNHPGGYRPHGPPLPRDGGSPRHRARAGRDAGRSQGAARRGSPPIGAWWGKKMGIPGERPPQCDRRRAVPARRERGRPARDAGDGCGDRRRRRVAMDACRVARRLPGLQARQGDLPAGPGGDPGAQDRARGAIEEGIEFIYHTQQTAIVPQGNGACGALR